MPITIEIPDNFFSEEEKIKLMELFQVEKDQDFYDAIRKITLAALDEYREMLLRTGTPSRADEIREYRLYHLIKHYFCGRIPDELEVSSMFQLSDTRCKNLIMNVITRFRFNLEPEITSTLQNIVNDAQEIGDGGEFRVYIQSANMVDELNRIIGRAGGRYKKLSKVRNETNLYAIAPDSYLILRQNLRLGRR